MSTDYEYSISVVWSSAVRPLRFVGRRLTNGLRRIFDPLASLAGLALSAFALERGSVVNF